LSPGRHPLDFRAPSFWHAACFLLASHVKARASRTPFASDTNTFETFFGSAPVFRGQSRAWNISPTGWRQSDPADPQRRRIFRQVIESFAGPEDAVEFELFGRPRLETEGEALAQHYGLPTNLVDFTFDPRVALAFAVGDTEEVGAGPEPHAYGVVFFVSFSKLCLSGRFALAFPPVQARRLFRQSGFFVDYGPRQEAVPDALDFGAPWMWVQQNCGRVFFPRVYPSAPEASEVMSLTQDILQPEPFLAEVAERVAGLSAEVLDAEVEQTVAAVRSQLVSRPPWRVKELDEAFFYTDDEIVSVATSVESYVRTAALREMAQEPHLDPIVVAKIAEGAPDALHALRDVSRLPFAEADRFQWVVAWLMEAVVALREGMPPGGGDA
jgi:hypothetical protein